VDYSVGESCGNLDVEQHDRVGNLDLEDDHLDRTFRGSRICSFDTVVNQNITLSFDPQNLTCTTCTASHSIVPKDGRGLIIFITDQNFVSAVGGTDSCVPVIRMEDPSLEELFVFTKEVLGRSAVPSGSLFLVGAASHLQRVGTTLYALEWQRVVSMFAQRWPNAQVGPLPPALREDCPGTLIKNLVEIRYWFDRVYGNNIIYPKDAWDSLITQVNSLCVPPTMLEYREKTTIALPLTLHDSTLFPHKVAASATIPIFPGMGAEATRDLVLTLIGTLTSRFGCRANPGGNLQRAPAECGSAKENTTNNHTVIVTGSSHARRLASSLKEKGVTCTWVDSDCCKPLCTS
jgi:hypothetical protein